MFGYCLDHSRQQNSKLSRLQLSQLPLRDLDFDRSQNDGDDGGGGDDDDHAVAAVAAVQMYLQRSLALRLPASLRRLPSELCDFLLITALDVVTDEC